MDSSGNRCPSRSAASRSSRSRRNARRCSAVSSVSALMVISPITSSRGSARRPSSSSGQPRRLHPALLRLVGAVHLHQHLLPGPGRRSAVQLGAELEPVHRMDEREPAGGVARLVALQGPDQVPGHSQVSGSWSCFSSASWTRFSPTSSRPACAAARTRLGPVALGDGDDSDRMSPPRDGLMPGHRLTHPGEAAGQVREFHSLGI